MMLPDIAKKMRARVLRLPEKKVLIANLIDSVEASDKYTIVNCGGFGRIRQFSRFSIHLDYLLGYAKPLLRGHPPVDVLRSQVFQLAACNWRCWYCFVDDPLLNGKDQNARFFSADELLDLYLAEDDRPKVIDLSGGQPDLVPEWTLWMIDAMARRGLEGSVYLWSDDDLGTDFIWECLSNEEIRRIAESPLHTRVGCFKGFDEASFSFNTGAPSDQFEMQFVRFKKLLDAGFDLYAYATLTSSSTEGINKSIDEFMDRLQAVHYNLPLRTIPLRICLFSATRRRSTPEQLASLESQHAALHAWQAALESRYSQDEISIPYDLVSLK